MHQKNLERIAHLVAERIEVMQQTDKIDGKSATLEQYLLWAFEEAEANDNITIERTNL